MNNIKITIEIDDTLYNMICTGKKLLEQELEEKYNRIVIVKADYFLRWAVNDYIDSQKKKPNFNEN